MSTKSQIWNANAGSFLVATLLLMGLVIGCDGVPQTPDTAQSDQAGDVTVLRNDDDASGSGLQRALTYDAETGTEWEETLPPIESETVDALDPSDDITEVEPDLLQPPTVDEADADKSDSAERIIGADDRILVSPATSYPWKAVGFFLCVFPNGKAFSGTGAMVGRWHVLTAAHVIYSSANGGWAKQIIFIPGKSGNSEPYGRAGWRRAHIYSTQYVKYGQWDVGLVMLDRPMGDKTGWFGRQVRSDASFDNAWMNSAGYPGDKTTVQMYRVYGQTDYVQNDRVVHWLDTIAGQSGSPIWVLSNGQRYIVAVLTAECNWANCRENYAAKVSSGVFNWITNAIKSDGG